MTARGFNADRGEPEKLEYPACPGLAVREWPGWVEVGGGDTPPTQGRASRVADDAGIEGENEGHANRQSFECGRARGREEGRQLEREAQRASLGAEADRRMQQLRALAERFADASEGYFREVEHEVVKLALAVASRILRREAQMDPLLLTGAVRMALGQLAASSEVRLLVPAAELELWREAIAHLPRKKMKLVIVANDEMLLGDCAIESQVGSVDLGVRAQLAEIERGFFDRAPDGAPPDADRRLAEEEG